MMWSPQQYKFEGLKKGLSETVLERLIKNSEDAIVYSGYKLPSILSLGHLSKRTGISYTQLRGFVSRDNSNAYKNFYIKKRTGGYRSICVPSSSLMHIQRWINKYILKSIPVHYASYAFSNGNSIKECASRHCGAKWLIKLDIADFFGSISEIQVFRLFRDVGYKPLVSFELSRLCTIATLPDNMRKEYPHWEVNQKNSIINVYHQDFLGYVPQGAPTSPLISNLVMRKCDKRLTTIARQYGLTYTRYSDDLSFSTRSLDFNREKAKCVIHEVYKILSRSGYLPQFRKTKIISPRSKKIVLGLNVDGITPKLPKDFKNRIRQHLYYLEKCGVIAHVHKRKFDSILRFKFHLKGMIDYANMIEPEYAKTCLEKFNKLEWPI